MKKQFTVELLHNTPLWVTDLAISKCYDKNCDRGEPNEKRIRNVAVINKHKSTIEHLNYSFLIKGISRAVLQELARHRIASLSVKSTRYTLKELKELPAFEGRNIGKANNYLVMVGEIGTDMRSLEALVKLQEMVKRGVKNDVLKYCMPESYKTELVWSINARSLSNFLSLRVSKHALAEIRLLALEIYDKIPEDHKFIFDGLVTKPNQTGNDNE